MTYQEAAQTAIACQDARNLSGVVKSLAGPVMDALWAEARRTGKGTDWINQHPIVTLMLDKLASLNRSQGDLDAYAKSIRQVEQIAASEPEPPRLHEDNCGRTGGASMASCKLDCACWCHKEIT